MSLNLDSTFKSSIPDRLEELKSTKVVIVGDVGLDEYIQGDVRKISPEAPVPVVEVNSESAKLGLSCNVAANVVSLGGQVELIGVVGMDRAREQVSQLLEDSGVSSKSLIVDESRPTTRKTRIMAEHQQVVRVDHEHKRFVDTKIEDQILQQLESQLESCRGVILEDYAKGVLSERVCQQVIQMARQKQVPVLVDPYKSSPIHFYRGASLLTPNRDEAIFLSGILLDEMHHKEDFIEKVGRSLMEQIQSENMVITEGKRGMCLFDKDSTLQLPTFARDVFDVTGAGDTVIAAVALGWCSGWTLPEACMMANFAAGYVVSQLGCVTCSPENLKAEILAHGSTAV